MLPWNRADARFKKALEKTLWDFRADVAELQSRPVPEDWRPDVMAVEGNLAALTVTVDSITLPQELIERIDSLEAKNKEMTFAVAEGIERTARAERRIGQTIARARAELQKRGFTDPGIEAEDRHLRLVNAEGGDGGGVSDVPEEVAEPTGTPSSVRGVSVEQLRAARGF